jgi:hypothetical protein
LELHNALLVIKYGTVRVAFLQQTKEKKANQQTFSVNGSKITDFSVK